MNSIEYLKSYSQEFLALSNRLRYFIGGAHWPSDGSWKESIVRSALRRHVPPAYQLLNGFIAANTGLSKQCDILIYDTSRPALFRDGDFCVLPPDSIMGIIEVKTTFRKHKFKEELESISNNIASVRKNGNRGDMEGKIFASIMYFGLENNEFDHNSILNILKETCSNCANKIDFICFGSRYFARYWWEDSRNDVNDYNSWHIYDLNELSFGYFLMNVIECLAPYSLIRSGHWWFPSDGKEAALIGKIKSEITGRCY